MADSCGANYKTNFKCLLRRVTRLKQESGQACVGSFGIGVMMLDTALTVSGVPGLSTPAAQPK